MDLPDIQGVLIAGLASAVMVCVCFCTVFVEFLRKPADRKKPSTALILAVFLLTILLVTVAIFFLNGGKNE